jgi:hypothetical protein
MLARVMLFAIDILLAGEPLGLETARDLFREVPALLPGASGRVLVSAVN